MTQHNVKVYNDTGREVPIKKIRMDWHEGRTDGPTFQGKEFDNWKQYDTALRRINEDNKRGREYGMYNKTQATFTWEDGTKHSYRIDLGERDYNPDSNRYDHVGEYVAEINERRKNRGKDGRKLSTKLHDLSDEKFTPGASFKRGDEVEAKELIEENEFGGEEVWTHAKPGDKGWVEDVDDNGYPTVRFENSQTATITGSPEVMKTGKRYKMKRIAILDQDLGGVRYAEVREEKLMEDAESRSYGDEWMVVNDRRKQSRNESYLDQADSSPMGGSMGPGKGWHGERMRHREAALKRGMN